MQAISKDRKTKFVDNNTQTTLAAAHEALIASSLDSFKQD